MEWYIEKKNTDINGRNEPVEDGINSAPTTTGQLGFAMTTANTA